MRPSPGDSLLFAISAADGMDWHSFTRTFEVLRPSSAADQDLALTRSKVVGALSALGHCEVVTRDSTQWIFAAPAVLARLPLTGLPQAAVVGRRQPATAEAIQTGCSNLDAYLGIEIEDLVLDGYSLLPSRITIEAESTGCLDELARCLGIAYLDTPPAWSLCAASRTLEAILSDLRWEERPHLDWARRSFDSRTVRMATRRDVSESDELALWSYEHPFTRQQRFEIRRGSVAAVIDRNWGRWAVLVERSRYLLKYDERRHVLCAPGGAPLPRLIARALCLCSGAPPTEARLDAMPYLLYNSVPPQIAEKVGSLLAQPIVATSISLSPARAGVKGASH